jgi:Holliday junction resolvase RusA-like endonuclease
MTLEFRVVGVAIPKGSTKAFGYYAKNKRTGDLLLNRHGKPILLASTSNANPKTKDWAGMVAQGASQALELLAPSDRGLLLDGVRVTLAFYLPRPQSLPRRVLAHTKAPDLDKLARNIFDALTNVVFRDDAQIVDVIAMKRYAGPGDAPHVDIRVEPAAGVVPLAHDQPLFAMVR